MRQTYTLELIFLLLVIALSLAGFSGLYVGEQPRANAYHHLHVLTSLGWLGLLSSQLILIRQQRFQRHRAIGMAIAVAGPLLVASLALLSVHSAARDAAVGRADALVVQNITVTLEVALLVFLAFLLRKNRKVHGALLLSTALLFMGIALFFTLIDFVPKYRIEGPATFHRFTEAAQACALAVGVVGLAFFLRDWRNGWPWLLTGAFFFVNGLLQMLVARAESTKPLTEFVASIGRGPAFVGGLVVFAALLWLAWRFAPARRDHAPTAFDAPVGRSHQSTSRAP